MPTFPSGVRPVRTDHRDLSFPRTFGSIATFPKEFNLEWKKSAPDQNAAGHPFGCTGYTQSEICGDEDQAQYDPQFTYDQTRAMEGTSGQDVGCDIRNSLSSTIVHGVKAKNEPAEKAISHRRGAYYNVVDETGLDCFDDVRSALMTNKRTVSAATPWFPEWADIPRSGIVPAFAVPPELRPGLLGIFAQRGSVTYSWHNWKIAGWKEIDGKPYLIGKPWQGKRYGDQGYIYFSRELFNLVAGLRGSGFFTVRKAGPGDVQRIKLELFKAALSYCQVWLRKLLTQQPVRFDVPTPEPRETPVEPAPVPVTPPPAPKLTNREHLYAVAKSCLGRDMAKTQNELGCAESVNAVHKLAFGKEIGGGSSTALMLKALAKHPDFIEVDAPLPGDVWMNATGTSTKGTKNGHVGIVGNTHVMSNNSRTYKWDAHYTLAEWSAHFEKKLGFPSRYFRRVGVR